ncbi:MAG TPA: glycoside hydrolase family 97 C-terminal domain-containing protein, partial [Rhodothermales bacterium]|nr:glycoside hydrolase family 97 C-terminal domain-containing protein [Rhodothermales bacterium]
LDLFYPEHKPRNRVNMTLAKALALYVTIYSPLHMVADLPENLEGHPAMPWLEAVPTDWDTTLVLHAKIGDYTTFVRKDRRSDDWYLGAVTDDTGRLLEAPLSFLTPGRTYVAEAYEDGLDADWRTEAGALDLRISQRLVRSTDTWPLRLAPGGGAALRFRPATREDERRLGSTRR